MFTITGLAHALAHQEPTQEYETYLSGTVTQS